MRRPRLAVALLLLGVLLAALLAVLRTPGTVPRPDAAPATSSRAPRAGTVTWIYDGDTIKVEGVGKVRLIGIDAFDGHNEDKMRDQARHYGMTPVAVRDLAERGTRAAIDALKGRRVVLHPGYESEDDYGRMLAYVHVTTEDGTERDFNLQMLESGLAAAFRAFEHPRLDAYLAAEERAREQRKGIWAHARLRP